MNTSGFLSRLLVTLVLFAGIGLFSGSAAQAEERTGPADRDLLRPGLEALSRGHYEEAAGTFRQVLVRARRSANPDLVISASGFLADALSGLGRSDQAIEVLKTSIPVAETSAPQRLKNLFQRIGMVHARDGNLDLAETFLSTSRKRAAEEGDRRFYAFVTNDLAGVWAVTGRVDPARQAFEESHRIARELHENPLTISTGNNLARIAVSQRSRPAALAHLEENEKRVPQLDDDVRKIRLLLETGRLMRDAQVAFGLAASWRAKAYGFIAEAGTLAGKFGDERLLAYAQGYLGRLYEDENRIEDALYFTRRAIFLADESNAPESRYLWEWQAGRLTRAAGDSDTAIQYFRQAVISLDEVRSQVLAGVYDGFREKIRPVYAGLADLLLTKARATSDPDARNDLLQEVRRVLEKTKVAEVEDYFQDECLVVQDNPTSLDDVSQSTAILYPIIFPDRTEMIVTMADRIHWFTVHVTEGRLTEEIRSLRKKIEIFDPQNTFLPHAQLLYRWLIKPVESALEENHITNIVFVPDAALRSIPLSVLHDGRGFLVERFSVVTTAGLTLTSSTPLQREGRILLAGITDGVQGFPPLPSVGNEIRNINELNPQSRVLLNQDVVLENLQDQVSGGRFNVVHLATHGQFDRDHRKSFLLTYDKKLTMSRLGDVVGLRRYQGQPLDLIVMSACQTAAGDDRAALGLAGVALQAGARSALASLWFVNDQATSELMTDFFRELENPDNTKAEALQKAQLKLIRRDGTRHPVFWAPFLLLGNWL